MASPTSPGDTAAASAASGKKEPQAQVAATSALWRGIELRDKLTLAGGLCWRLLPTSRSN